MARHRVKTFLLASTRGKLLDRLRRAPQTVEELAVALGITDNGVRAHLAVLEQDGLVRRGGLRPTARRPSQTYRLASGAEALFCHGYVPFFGELLNVLAHKMPRPELEATVRSVGERLGAREAPGSLAARVKTAAACMEDLGGITEIVTRRNGGVTFAIHGLSCPLEAVVRSHPEVCAAIETLVAATTRAYARQRCHHKGDQPHCLIEVSATPPRP